MFNKNVDYQQRYKSLLKENDFNILADKLIKHEDMNHFEFLLAWVF